MESHAIITRILNNIASLCKRVKSDIVKYSLIYLDNVILLFLLLESLFSSVGNLQKIVDTEFLALKKKNNTYSNRLLIWQWLLYIFVSLPTLYYLWRPKIDYACIYNFIIEYCNILLQFIKKINVCNDHATVATIQVTLFALILPIAVALQEFHLKDSDYKSQTMDFILEKTKVKCITRNSVLLLVIILLLPSELSSLWKYILNIIIFIWLTINMFLITKKFMFTSLRFMNRSFLYDAMSEDFIQYEYPKEVKNHMARNFYSALSDTLITKKADTESSPNIIFASNGFLFSAARNEVKTKFSRKMVLTDVNVKILRALVNNWKKRNSLFLTNEQENNVTLFFPLVLGQSYHGAVTLLRSNGIEKKTSFFTYIEKLAVRYAFKFSHHSNTISSKLNSTDLLRMLAEFSILSIKQNNKSTFDERFEQLITVHKNLLQAGKIESNNNIVNFCEINSTYFSSLYQEWNDIYSDIFKESIYLLGQSPRFFRKCTYYINKLYSENDISVISLKGTISQQGRLWFDLNEWWENNIREKSEKNRLSHQPLSTIYTDALKEFIGMWENVYKFILVSHAEEVEKADNINTWNVLKNLFQGFEEHLTSTILFLTKSVLSRNKEAAEQWVEHLLCLYDRELPTNSRNQNYTYEIENNKSILVLLTTTLLEQSWEEIEKTIFVCLQNNGSNITPKILFFYILKNYYQDAYIILTDFLLLLAVDSKNSEEHLAIDIVQKLLNIKNNYTSMGFNKGTLIKDFEDYFASFIRRSSYHHFNKKEYGAKLDTLAQRIESAMEEKRIPSRIYSYIGSSIEKSYEADAIISAIIAQPRGNIIIGRYEELFSQNENIARSIVNALETRITTINKIEHTKYTSVYNTIVEKEPEEKVKYSTDNEDRENLIEEMVVLPVQPLIDKLNIVKNALNELLELANTVRTNRIRTLPQSEIKLKKIAEEASSKAFNKETADFPVILFKHVELVTEALEKFKLRLIDFPKGNITEPQMEFIDFGGQHCEAVSLRLYQYLIINILQEAKKLKIIEEIPVTTESEYASNIIKLGAAIKNKGLSPILIAETYNTPEWIDKWASAIWNQNIKWPEGIVITKKQRANSYMLDVCDIPLYVGYAMTKGTLLLPEEILSKVKFRKYKSGYPVDTTFENNENDPWKGTLTFHWEMEVELDPQYKVYNISYSKNENKVKLPHST